MTGSAESAQASSPELRQYAALVTAGVLTVIVLGAYVTSEALVSQPPPGSPVHATAHRLAAIAVGFLALVLALWQWLAQDKHLWGCAAVGTYVFDGWLGWMGWPVLHASLAPLALALMVALLLVMSPGWNEAPEMVDDRAGPLLRPLAISAPPLVLLQILLGAAYRHKDTGVIPHLGGAMLVSLVTLVASMLVLQQYPQHRALRLAARWLISILIAQITLGATSFAMQLLGFSGSPALVIASTAHVVVGSLTLAASLVFTMQVQRNLRRATAEAAATTG